MSQILLIEDDLPVQYAIRRALVNKGYGVIGTSSGAGALEILELSSPDLILLDLYLPVLDGRQFVQAYRERPGPHAPILVITGAGYAAERAAALEVAGHLDKPFRPTELLTKVEDLIGPPAPGDEDARGS